MQKTNFQHIAFLAHSKFDVMNLVLIGIDNAFVMVGINNCVYTKVKKDVPSLIEIE